jgi:serralysin
VYAYDSYRRRVFVAAGDIDGDGKAEIITGKGNGSPYVRVWKVGAGGTMSEVASFYANDSTYRGGVTVAVGDVDGDGKAEIITEAGPNRSSSVRVWKVGAGGSVGEIVRFSAYDSSYRTRVYVAAGNVDGDGMAEIVTGAAAVSNR